MAWQIDLFLYTNNGYVIDCMIMTVIGVCTVNTAKSLVKLKEYIRSWMLRSN